MPNFSTLLQSKGSSFRDLEIRLDTPVVSLVRRSRREGIRVRGRIVFVNSSNLRVESIIACLNGIQQVVWYTDSMTADRIRDKDVVFSGKVSVVPAEREKDNHRPFLLGPGNYVWPFEFDLTSCHYESINGLGETYLKYEVCATMAIAGRFAKSLRAKKEIKIVRDPCIAEVGDLEPEQDDHGTWTDRLDYHVAVSPQHHEWGQPITTTFKMNPLAKGITVESISLRLIESVHLKASLRDRDLYHRKNIFISEIQATEADNTALQSMTDTSEDQLEMVLPLPRTLQGCR